MATDWKSRAFAALAATPNPQTRAVFAMPIDADDGFDDRIVGELRDRVARAFGIDLRVRPSTRWDEAFTTRTDAPQLAILRDDALQSARGRVPQPLQIVTPLHTENILVLARRDAPISFVHEIEGLRINAGPASGARGLTATRLYQELFGARLPAARAQTDGVEAALEKLVDGCEVDAVVLARSDLEALFAHKPPTWKGRVKLLRLDRAHPSTRRGQRFFLASLARADASGGPLDQDMATLAAATHATGAEPLVSADGRVEPVTVSAVTRFGFDGTSLDTRDRARILADVGKMKHVTWQTVTATGYTDSVGSAGYHDRLSVRRAAAVKTYLVGKGLEPSMIDAAGKGAAVPIANNESATGRAQNRRTEIEFTGVRTVAP